ncbi:MAG: hypothetical protein ACE5J2_03290, partial [Nitrososphaerales archaeon]
MAYILKRPAQVAKAAMSVKAMKSVKVLKTAKVTKPSKYPASYHNHVVHIALPSVIIGESMG